MFQSKYQYLIKNYFTNSLNFLNDHFIIIHNGTHIELLDKSLKIVRDRWESKDNIQAAIKI